MATPPRSSSRSLDDRVAACLDAWGRLVHRRRGVLLAATLLLLAPIGLLLAQGGDLARHGEVRPPTESGLALDLVDADVPQSVRPSFLLVLSHETLTWEDETFRSEVERVVAPLRADPRVESVATPSGMPPEQARAMIGRDGHHVMVAVSMAGSAEDAQGAYPDVRALARSELLAVTATGSLALGHDFGSIIGEDLARAEMIGLPIALVILLVVFGAVVAALLPLGVGVVAVVGGVAATLFMARFTPIPDYAIQVVSLIGLGVAIDYCLFIVKRFREELRTAPTREVALGRSLATAGRAVVFSGVTVGVSLGGLAFFRGLDFAGVGLAAAAVVAFAVLFALTLLPAILAYLGPRVNALRVPGVRPDQERSPFWRSLSGWVMDRAWLVLVGVLAVAALLASPLLQLNLGSVDERVLPEDAESRMGFDLLAGKFEQQGRSSLTVVVDWGDAPMAPDRIRELYWLSERIEALDRVVAVASIVDVEPEWGPDEYLNAYARPREEWDPSLRAVADRSVGERSVLLQVRVDAEPSSDEARSVVESIRAIEPPAGAAVLVTGQTALDMDTRALIMERLPYAVAFIVLATLALMTLQVHSVVLPLKAVLMNAVSIGASFGAIVWVFQMGNLAQLLDFTPIPLDPANLVLIFCIVFGLSMDYEVLLLSRIHEEYQRTGDNRRAVQLGLERTGRLITGAALIMVFVFGAFGLVRLTFMKMIGLGLAFAVLMDATLVRALLVPALMRLMGRLNWWSPWSRDQAANTATTEQEGPP